MASTANNPDLYYQTITYEGLDISQIEIGNDCTAGFRRNRYDYDANHRVIRLSNTLKHCLVTNHRYPF